ncbi:MAG: hypothetical protein E6K80_07920 [Candidatus Eisenbacteria bacterium]|uniref:Uncharacterized protein n=1 Tax=Eiseniibacteriota bacterium TaxID=2212470 RepID=A0A538U435_UNCEI|nr:MAG: hypothetical protein E6K80_07920 [Candidatus Eisenbacteria bacterium]
MSLALHAGHQTVLRERSVLAADRRRLVALHGIVHQVRPSVRRAEIDSVVDLLAGHVIHRGVVAVVCEHDETGEAALLHQSIEVFSHGFSRRWEIAE